MKEAKLGQTFPLFLTFSAFLWINMPAAQSACDFSGFIQDLFRVIGHGEMDVTDRIYDTSNQIQYAQETVISDKGIKYPKFTRMVWVGDKSPIGYVPDLYSVRSITLCEMNNVVFTTECVILKPNGYHTFKHACHPRYWGIGLPYHKPHITFEKYNKVICIGHQHSSDWGHWFLEVLPGFAALPRELLQTCNIAIPFARDFVIDGFEFIGVSKNQLITGDNVPYYAEKFYTIKSTWCGDLNRFLLINMKNMFIQNLNIKKVPPTRFVVFNRPSTMSRHIGNMPVIFSTIKARWPEIPFEMGTFGVGLRQQGEYFAQMKFVFSIHGSVLANEIFMDQGTVVVELQMEAWLLSFINLGQMTGINQILGRDVSISYKSLAPNNVSVDYIVRLFNAGLTAGKYI